MIWVSQQLEAKHPGFIGPFANQLGPSVNPGGAPAKVP